MDHLEFLVEEPSMEAALRVLVPKILGEESSFEVHAYQGKHDLLAKLPLRLRGYRRWLPATCGIVVVVDEDREDCRRLKARMEASARASGLVTRRQRSSRAVVQVVNWIAIEELEAWFLGDPQALARAYPGVSGSLGRRAAFRDPDAVAGGTWEALERVLCAAGHHAGGLSKIAAARDIAPHMDPARNSSRSFQGFVRALRRLA